jgi:protein involved in polysaccharide export with SLBB domain
MIVFRFFYILLVLSLFAPAEGSAYNRRGRFVNPSPRDLQESLRHFVDTTYNHSNVDSDDILEFADIDYKELWRDEWEGAKQLPEKYRLHVGDQLFVSVYGFPEPMPGRVVRVENTGEVVLPIINAFSALGKTVDEFRELAEKEIQKEYPHVLLSVTPVQITGSKFAISGTVRQPGVKKLVGHKTLLQGIAEAGGFPLVTYRGAVVDQADLSRAFIARNNDYLPVNFERLVKEGDPNENIELKNGDYIYIPPAREKKIYVLRDDNVGSTFAYMRTATLLEVVAATGGMPPNGYASAYALIIRGSLGCPTHYLVNIERIMKGCCTDFTLQPNDIVVIPRVPFARLIDLIKGAIRTFVGSFAIEVSDRIMENIFPDFNPDNNNPIFINPGSVVNTNPVIITAPPVQTQ